MKREQKQREGSRTDRRKKKGWVKNTKRNK